MESLITRREQLIHLNPQAIWSINGRIHTPQIVIYDVFKFKLLLQYNQLP